MGHAQVFFNHFARSFLEFQRETSDIQAEVIHRHTCILKSQRPSTFALESHYRELF